MNEETKTYSVIFHGFKTKEEAEQFVSWYCGQGEQDATYWFEERAAEGLPVRKFIERDCRKKEVWDGDTLVAWMKED